MTPLSKQDCIDKVREHFSKPGAVYGVRTIEVVGNSIPKCVYRGESDRNSPVRCGIGSLMPDEFYRPKFDKDGGMAVVMLWYDVPGFRKLFADDVTATFLGNLQDLHDQRSVIAKIPEFLQDLTKFAHANGCN